MKSLVAQILGFAAITAAAALWSAPLGLIALGISLLIIGEGL